jgi:RHS repeat-associated protein
VVTLQNGKTLETHHFFAYGEEFSGARTSDEKLLFTGHERDKNGMGTVDDLDYMHARYYGPQLGRFLSADPVLGRASRPQSWNRYSYGGNSPLRFVDPDGRATVFAETIASGLEDFGSQLSAAGDSSNDGTLVGIVGDTAAGTIGDLVGESGDMFRVGDASGEAIGSGAHSYDVAKAVSIDVARASQLFVSLGAAAGSAAGVGPKVGSAGGPGARARFSNATKIAAREESQTCVFCGVGTTRSPGPRQSNIDHAIAKSRGGNNLPDNAQNTCRTCNLQKNTQSSVGYFFRRLFRWVP